MEGITFPRPTAPGPIYFFTAPDPNYLFTAPNDGITFSRPPASKITSNKSLSCLFTPLNKTQPAAYLKIPLSKKTYHT